MLEEPLVRLSASDLTPWLERAGERTLVVPETPVGAGAEAIAAAAPGLAAAGVTLRRIRRGWDARAWPHATKGFFPFKERIPELLRAEGLL